MKCLSLWQPWATLMAIGAKQIETRSWETLYRGPLLIHAAKKWNADLSELCYENPHIYKALASDGELKRRLPMSDAEVETGKLPKILPLGCIVAIVDLIDCRRVGSWVPDVSDQEIAFGDYTPGRFAWITKNLRRLPEPIPYRGAQGLFDIPDEVCP